MIELGKQTFRRDDCAFKWQGKVFTLSRRVSVGCKFNHGHNLCSCEQLNFNLGWCYSVTWREIRLITWNGGTWFQPQKLQEPSPWTGNLGNPNNQGFLGLSAHLGQSQHPLMVPIPPMGEGLGFNRGCSHCQRKDLPLRNLEHLCCIVVVGFVSFSLYYIQ